MIGIDNELNNISCSSYDYIEVACLHHYEVELVLKNGERHSGRCETTVILPKNIEALELSSGGDRIQIALNQLDHLKVNTPGANFESISFH